MSTNVIDGNAIARQVRDELVPRIEALRQRGIQPGLAVVLVGEHPASVTYVRGKMKDSAELGITSETFRLPAEASQQEIIDRTANQRRSHMEWIPCTNAAAAARRYGNRPRDRRP